MPSNKKAYRMPSNKEGYMPIKIEGYFNLLREKLDKIVKPMYASSTSNVPIIKLFPNSLRTYHKDGLSATEELTLPLWRRVAWFKFLNPFKAVEAACVLGQGLVGNIIDKIVDTTAQRGGKYQSVKTHPVAMVLKTILQAPFALVRALVSPFSILDNTKPFQELARFLGFKKSVEKESNEIELTAVAVKDTAVHSTSRSKTHSTSNALMAEKLHHRQNTQPTAPREEQQKAVIDEPKQKVSQDLSTKKEDSASVENEDESENSYSGMRMGG